MSFKKICNIFGWLWWGLPASIWVNFKKLPFKQAYKLPILLFKPKLLSISGDFVLEAPARFGMIRLGINGASIYPDNGIKLENRGKIIFKGRAIIGNDCALAVGNHGHLIIGDGFRATAAVKIICYNHTEFGNDVLIGWNCMFCDTDFHSITMSDGSHSCGCGDIRIGNNCWIANSCKVYKNVTIPPFCVVGSDTVLYKSIECEPRSLICNDTTIMVKATGVWHDRHNDRIDYSSNR